MTYTTGSDWAPRKHSDRNNQDDFHRSASVDLKDRHLRNLRRADAKPVCERP